MQNCLSPTDGLLHYNKLVDVWSYGCVLACIHTREDHPYPGVENPMKHLHSGKLRPIVPTDSPLYGAVLTSTEPEPEDRRPFDVLLEDLKSDGIRELCRIHDEAPPPPPPADDEKPAPPARTSTAGRLVRQLTAKLGGPAVVKEAQTMSAPAAEAAAGYSMNNFTMTDARRTSGKSMDAVRV